MRFTFGPPVSRMALPTCLQHQPEHDAVAVTGGNPARPERANPLWLASMRLLGFAWLYFTRLWIHSNLLGFIRLGIIDLAIHSTWDSFDSAAGIGRRRSTLLAEQIVLIARLAVKPTRV